MADYIDRALGELIRSARKEAGMTQNQLAKAMQVGQGTISRWEKGLPISDEYPDLLEDVLGIDLSPYKEAKGDVEEWLPVRSSSDLSDYVIAVARRITYDDDLRMALTLLVKNDWLNQEHWVVMVSRDQLIKELGRDVFDAVWPKVIASKWVERFSSVEFNLRLKYPAQA